MPIFDSREHECASRSHAGRVRISIDGGSIYRVPYIAAIAAAPAADVRDIRAQLLLWELALLIQRSIIHILRSCGAHCTLGSSLALACCDLYTYMYDV